MDFRAHDRGVQVSSHGKREGFESKRAGRVGGRQPLDRAMCVVCAESRREGREPTASQP